MRNNFKYYFNINTPGMIFSRVVTLDDIETGVSLDGIVNPFDYDNRARVQDTGLKDKNGTEIYEGDILEFDIPKYSKQPSPHPKIIGTEKDYIKICSVPGGFVMVRQFWWNETTCLHGGEAISDLQTATWIQENCEVIGNIYENPELLKKCKDI